MTLAPPDSPDLRPLEGPAPAPPASGGARARVRRFRGPIAVVVLLVVAAVVLGLVSAGRGGPQLSSRSAAPDGARALAELLRDRGATVTEAVALGDLSPTAAPDAVVLPDPARATADELSDLRDLAGRGATVLAVAPSTDELRRLAPGVRVVGGADVASRPPACALPAAVAAGTARVGGVLYAAPSGATTAQACYPAGRGAALLVLPVGSGRLVLLGDGAPLRNDRLADDGDAALSLNLLAGADRIAWFLPPAGRAGPEDQQQGLLALLPDRILYAALALFLAAAAAALWRGRRLGPPNVEPLPVVVRASETVEGRGRLYAAAGGGGPAAAALRDATVTRLGRLVGLGPRARPEALVDALATRTGRGAEELAALLYGPVPDDDAALVRLADGLDALDRQVRST